MRKEFYALFYFIVNSLSLQATEEAIKRILFITNDRFAITMIKVTHFPQFKITIIILCFFNCCHNHLFSSSLIVGSGIDSFPPAYEPGDTAIYLQCSKVFFLPREYLLNVNDCDLSGFARFILFSKLFFLTERNYLLCSRAK